MRADKANKLAALRDAEAMDKAALAEAARIKVKLHTTYSKTCLTLMQNGGGFE